MFTSLGLRQLGLQFWTQDHVIQCLRASQVPSELVMLAITFELDGMGLLTLLDDSSPGSLSSKIASPELTQIVQHLAMLQGEFKTEFDFDCTPY